MIGQWFLGVFSANDSSMGDCAPSAHTRKEQTSSCKGANAGSDKRLGNFWNLPTMGNNRLNQGSGLGRLEFCR